MGSSKQPGLPREIFSQKTNRNLGPLEEETVLVIQTLYFLLDSMLEFRVILYVSHIIGYVFIAAYSGRSHVT